MSFLNKEQIIMSLKQEIASAIDQNSDHIDENVSFLRFGIDSIQTITILNKIKKKLQVDLNPIAMFEYKNIAELAGYIGQCISETVMQ